MKQSNVIFGTLLLAFVIYVTLRGQLPAYLSLFTGSDAPINASAPGVVKPDTQAQDWQKAFDEFLSNMGFKN